MKDVYKYQLSFLIIYFLFGFLEPDSVRAQSLPKSEVTALQQTYAQLLRSFNQGNTLIGRDNLSGSIVWGEAYVLQSFLEMYEATGDTSYLDRFVRHADAVVAQRDDIAGRKDWKGQSRLGWQTDGHFTLGKPIILRDDHKAASLEVQAIHWAGNQATTIEVIRKDDKQYRLRIVNTFRGKKPFVLDFDRLTQETVEQRVNENLSPDSYIQVRRLGATPPASTQAPIRFVPQRVVLSTFHSPFILMPFTWFAYLVKQHQLANFAGKAESYLDMAQAIYEQNEPYWEDRAQFGFYRIEPDIPLWSAGLPAPLNAQSAHGLSILYLALATDKQKYMHRVKQLAGLISREVKVTAVDQHTMPYWFNVGYDGWDETRGRPRPRGNRYPRYKGSRAMEDVSHGTWTAQFVWAAHRAGVAFTTVDMKRWNRTAAYLIPETVLTSGILRSLPALKNTPSNRKPNYQPTYSFTAATWALFAVHDNQALYDRAHALYQARYKGPTSSGSVLLGWARLARLARELSR